MTIRPVDHAFAADWIRPLLGRPGAIVALIASGLVFWLASSVNAQMVAMRHEHQRLLDAQSAQLHYLRAICLNGATSESQRALCVYQEPR